MTSTVPTDIPAPVNLTGQRVLNRALLLQEHINVLTWSPRPTGPPVDGYRIYALENGTKALLGEVGSSTTHFWHRNVRQTGRYQYAVAALDRSETGKTALAIFMNPETAKITTAGTFFKLGLLLFDGGFYRESGEALQKCALWTRKNSTSSP